MFQIYVFENPIVPEIPIHMNINEINEKRRLSTQMNDLSFG